MKVWVAVLIIFFSLMFTISLFLIGFSVRVISASDHAIKVNNNVMEIYTDKLYSGGRYFAGLGYDYLRYTRRQKMIIFSDTIYNGDTVYIANNDNTTNETTTTYTQSKVTKNFTEDATILKSILVRTNEGLIVTVDACVFYKIGTTDSEGQKAAQLFNIWARFGNNWETPIRALTEGIILDVASRYLAYSFYTNRQEVQAAMETELRANLNSLDFTLASLDILNLNFEPAFQAAIEEAQIVIENTLTEQAYYDTLLVSAATKVAAASIDADIIILNAETNSNITYLYKQATANATTLTASIKIAGLQALMDELLFTETDILNFLWLYYQVYQSATSSSTTTKANLNIGIMKPAGIARGP